MQGQDPIGLSASEVAQQLAGDTSRSLDAPTGLATVAFDFGVVQAIVAPSGSVTWPSLSVMLSGGTSVITGVRYLRSYAPMVGDTVILQRSQYDSWVVGSLADGHAAGLTKLASLQVSAVSAASFTNIPQSFDHLNIRWALTGNQGAAVGLGLQFNGDTAAHYSYAGLDAGAGGAGNFGVAGATLAWIGGIVSSTRTSGVVDILAYAQTGAVRSVVANTARPDQNNTQVGSGSWTNTAAAVTRVDVVAATGTITGLVDLYGVA